MTDQEIEEQIKALLEPLGLTIDVRRKQTKTKRYIAQLWEGPEYTGLSDHDKWARGYRKARSNPFFASFARTGRTATQARAKLHALLLENPEYVQHAAELASLADRTGSRNRHWTGNHQNYSTSDIHLTQHVKHHIIP